jgi:hypothetical protein
MNPATIPAKLNPTCTKVNASIFKSPFTAYVIYPYTLGMDLVCSCDCKRLWPTKVKTTQCCSFITGGECETQPGLIHYQLVELGHR